MPDKVFVDTSVVLYALDKDLKKKKTAKKLLKTVPVISYQVLNESANVMFKKFNFSKKIVLDSLKLLMLRCDVFNYSYEEIKLAVEIKEKYKYSYYDSLIISIALSAGCKTLYSEDMHDGQVIERKLKIVNPFK